MNPIEQHDTSEQGKMAPRHPVPSFVFIDLRDNPTAWAEIENELPDEKRLPVH